MKKLGLTIAAAAVLAAGTIGVVNSKGINQSNAKTWPPMDEAPSATAPVASDNTHCETHMGMNFCATPLSAHSFNSTVTDVTGDQVVNLNISCIDNGDDTYSWAWEGRSTWSQTDLDNYVEGFCDGVVSAQS